MLTQKSKLNQWKVLTSEHKREVAREAKTLMSELEIKHKAKWKEIVNAKGRVTQSNPGYWMLVEFCRTAYKKAWHLPTIGKLIKRDRTTVYYYANRERIKERIIRRARFGILNKS